MSGYTIVNLNSDSAALAKAVKDALTKTNPAEVQDAWLDVAINSAKITAGVAELAANDPKWAGMLGSGATLASVEESARRIAKDLQSPNGFDNVKAGDALSVVGGISDLLGNVLVKPGPQLVAGLALKGVGAGAGIAQNIVGDQTIAQLLGTAPTVQPLVPARTFPNVNDGKTFAPDGVTPLGVQQTTQAGPNQRIQTIWIKDSNGNYQKVENVETLQTNGVWKSTALLVGQYNSDGAPIKATQYNLDNAGNTTSTKALVPTTGGSWVDAPAGSPTQAWEKVVGQTFTYQTTTLGGTANAGMYTATEVTNTQTGQVDYVIRHNGTGEAIASGSSYVVNANDTITTSSGSTQFTHGLTDGRLLVMQSADGSDQLAGSIGNDTLYGGDGNDSESANAPHWRLMA